MTGVTITILGHAEFGQTLTRADGLFDLAVNGGGLLTVHYAKDGYLPVQRQVQAPWRDYAWLPEVVMLPYDPIVTTIDLAMAYRYPGRTGQCCDRRTWYPAGHAALCPPVPKRRWSCQGGRRSP